MEEKEATKRTNAQNRAIHKLFTEIAYELNAQGIDQRTITTKLEGYTCPVTPQFIKEVWKSILYTMYRKTSTTDMETGEVDKCFDVLNKFLGEEFGIHCAFPSMQELLLADLDNYV